VRVLVACEYSGVVRDAFAARGHEAWSCDLLPSETPGNHVQGDVLPLLEEGWDLMVAHPPCTYLANSGVRWLFGGKGSDLDPVRWKNMEAGAYLFRQLLRAPIPRIAVENPVMHRYAKVIIGHHPAVQTIQPWMFGHGETKATQLWLRGLPPLVPTHVVTGREAKVHLMPPSPTRGHERSRTYPGIAAAMAEQWG
jgi:hypothetical protein